MGYRNIWRKLTWLWPILSLFLSIYFYFVSQTPADKFVQNKASELNAWLRNADQRFKLEMAELKNQPDDFKTFNALRSLSGEGVPWNTIAVFHKNKLLFWTSNNVPELADKPKDSVDYAYKVLANGYYLKSYYRWRNYTAIAYLPIRTRFPENSRFLKNHFVPPIQGIEQLKIVTLNSAGAVVRAPDNQSIFRLKLINAQSKVYDSSWAGWASTLFILSVVLFLAKVKEYLEARWIRQYPIQVLLGWTFLLVVFRIIVFNGRFAAGLQEFDLFRPELLAISSIIPSLGDLLLHSLMVVGVLSMLLSSRDVFRALLKTKLPLNWWRIVTPLAFLLVNLGGLFLLDLSSSIVLNSEIVIDLSKIRNLSYYSFLVYGLIIVLLVVWVILVKAVVRHLSSRADFWTFFLIQLFITCGIGTFQWWSVGEADAAILLIFLCMLAAWSISMLLKEGSARSYYVSLFGLSSVVFGYQLNEAQQAVTLNNAMLQTEKLLSPDDPTAGYLLLSQARLIQEDDLLLEQLSQKFTVDPAIRLRIQLQYLNGYLEGYNLQQVALIPGLDTAKFIADAQPIIKRYFSDARMGFELKIPFSNQGLTDTLFLKLQQKVNRNQSPYPVLLEDRDWRSRERFSDLSFAVYQKGALVRQGGVFPYALNDRKWQASFDGEVIHQKGTTHLIAKPDYHLTIVVSFNGGYVLRWMVTASFLFMSGMLVFLLFGLGNVAFADFNLRPRITYQLKIELAFMGSAVLILLVVGYITLQYTLIKGRQRQHEQISMRIQSISSSIENEMGPYFRLNQEFFFALSQMARNYGADVNVFALNGKLLYSTQPGIYQRNLLASYIEPQAIFQMNGLQKTVFVQQEAIGKLKYLSAYIPLNGRDNQKLAILNLPGFTDPYSERDSLNDLIGNLVNLYILFLLLVSVLALRFSEKITAPLRQITRIISETRRRSASSDQLLQREDELGQILKEYYRVVEELEKSAALLAKTQREEAWRDMARQVAHEIKNPLTPIKLSIQYLQKAWKDEVPDFDRRLARITQTVLEQIESLNRIAGEFSAFAQMPVSQKERLNLDALIESVVDLFKESATIYYHNETQDASVYIHGDADQMQRVLNNLIKNGIQAVSSAQPVILVFLQRTKNQLLVTITDNGPGIPDDLADKIFTPNFTTKSSGMGLGLAIVRKIIEQHDGKIGFTNLPDGGASFWFSLPLYEEKDS